MAKQNVIIDLGTSFITIYNGGLLIKQPNISIVKKDNGLKILAIGNDAFMSLDKIPQGAYAVRPIDQGSVVNQEVLTLMIGYFLDEIVDHKKIGGVDVTVIVSCGLALVERDSIERAVIKAGYKDVNLIESVKCLAPLVNPNGSAVLILGGGTTEVAIINSKDIVTACSTNIAGNIINQRIIEQILNTLNIKISSKTVERLKQSIGSLYDNDNSTLEITGKGFIETELKNVTIMADEIKAPIAYCFKRIVDLTESLISSLPLNMIADITSRGLYVAGGGAEIRGLEDYITKYLKIKVNILNDPQNAVIRGAIILLENKKIGK